MVLREVLNLAESSVINDLLDQQGIIQKSSNFWNKNHPEYHKMHKEVQKLASKQNELSYAFNASIIFCPVCMKIDKDMTYNPVLKKWYCMECYEASRKFQIEEGRPDLFP
ncbi:MAG: hypothetical protein ACFFB0_14240 [Promethearchaeota archaeon]